MMENKDEKKVNLAREMLKTISAQIHLLVESGQFATVNEAVIETCYKSEEHQVFKKFHEWKDEGKKIKKGSKGFPVWSRPLDIKKDEKHPDLEKDIKYYPICYLFSNSQVEEPTPEMESKIAELQLIVDDLKATPEYQKYVDQRKLCLIDSRLRSIDLLLSAGILS